MLHPTTFAYLKPSDMQLAVMDELRRAAADYATKLGTLIPDGPDKSYILRELRGLAMWANVAVSRAPDGSPRV